MSLACSGSGSSIPDRTIRQFQARYRPALRPLKQDVVGDVGRTLWVLMGAIGVVLLMACANVANLLLVRADARRQEFAIRAALGARWTRIARQLLVESLMLAVLGGVLGVGLAYGGLRVLVAIGPSNLPRLSEISLDAEGPRFRADDLPAVRAPVRTHPDSQVHRRPLLADAVGCGANSTRESQRWQQTLVAAQMALALVLLVSAGLMIRSFQALRRVDPGFTRATARADVQHLDPADHGRRARARDARAAGNSGQDRRHSRRHIGGVHDSIAHGPRPIQLRLGRRGQGR